MKYIHWHPKSWSAQVRDKFDYMVAYGGYDDEFFVQFAQNSYRADIFRNRFAKRIYRYRMRHMK